MESRHAGIYGARFRLIVGTVGFGGPLIAGRKSVWPTEIYHRRHPEPCEGSTGRDSPIWYNPGS